MGVYPLAAINAIANWRIVVLAIEIAVVVHSVAASDDVVLGVVDSIDVVATGSAPQAVGAGISIQAIGACRVIEHRKWTLIRLQGAARGF